MEIAMKRHEERETGEWPPISKPHGTAIALAGRHSGAATDGPPASMVHLLPQAGRQVADLLAATVIGAGVLILFLLALAWDPLDRRLGFRARRYERRLALRFRRSPAAGGP
jgi:hypothetical protein